MNRLKSGQEKALSSLAVGTFGIFLNCGFPEHFLSAVGFGGAA